MLHTTKTYELGNTIYFEVTYRNISSVLTDPTSPGWRITNIRGELIDSDASGGPYKRSDGLWYIFWTSSDVGDYILEFSGTINGEAAKIRRPFKVVKTSVIY